MLATASVLLCFGGMVTPIVLQAGVARTVADRLLWAAALLGTPLLFTHVRRLMTGRRPPWQLIAGIALVAVGLLGYPVVPAVAAALALIVRTLRAARTRSCPDGCTNACCATAPASSELDAAGARQAG